MKLKYYALFFFTTISIKAIGQEDYQKINWIQKLMALLITATECFSLQRRGFTTTINY